MRSAQQSLTHYTGSDKEFALHNAMNVRTSGSGGQSTCRPPVRLPDWAQLGAVR